MHKETHSSTPSQEYASTLEGEFTQSGHPRVRKAKRANTREKTTSLPGQQKDRVKLRIAFTLYAPTLEKLNKTWKERGYKTRNDYLESLLKSDLE